MASRSGKPDASKPPNFDVFVGPPRHIERVNTALEIYMEKIQGMRTAKAKLLSCMVDMCPKHWKIRPELRVYIEDQSTLWSLAVSDLRPLFKRLKIYRGLTKTAQQTLEEFKKRLEEVRVMQAEYELMKESPNSSKNQLMQIEYMIRESNRALKAIRTTVEECLLEFRNTQTEIGRDLLHMFEEIQRVTCSESLQVIDVIEDRLKAVPAKKRNRNGQAVDDLEFVLQLVQAEVDKVEAKPVDLGPKIEQYNNHLDSEERKTSERQTHNATSNRTQGHCNYNRGQDHDNASVPFSNYDNKSVSSQSRPSSRGQSSTVDKGHSQYRPPYESLSSQGNQSFDSHQQMGMSRGQGACQGQKKFQNPHGYSDGSSTNTLVSRISRSKTPAPNNEFPDSGTSLYNGYKSSTDGFFSATPFSKSRSNVVKHVQAPLVQTGNRTGPQKNTQYQVQAIATPTRSRTSSHQGQDQRQPSRPPTSVGQGQSDRNPGQGQERRSSRPSTPADPDRRTSRPTTPASDKSRPSSRQSRESKRSSRASSRMSQPGHRPPCYSYNAQGQGYQRNIECDESMEDLFFSPTKVKVEETPRCTRSRQPFKSFNFPENSAEEFADDFQDCH